MQTKCVSEMKKYVKFEVKKKLWNYTNENKNEHNPKWPHIPDHPYRMLITRGSGSGKTNVLLNLI